jgi:hypothetical protein
MPAPTTELGLLKGVDADDTADYLVTSLANSLTTVDGLFNNVSGHTHGGAHQGGPISSTAIANGSITNAQLGPDVARANLLTNGGFEIWQRGNGPFAASGGWTADRWQNSLQGTDTLSISRDTANADVSGACAACTFTKGTGTNSTILQTLVLSEFTGVRGKTVTLSVRVKTSTASAARAFIQVDATPTLGTTHTGDGTYQTLTVSAAIGSAASGVYIGVAFSASCTAYIDNACLVVGSQPANYVPLHPADDLARCLRYYEIQGTPSNSGQTEIALGQCFSTTSALVFFKYMAQKPVSPTVTQIGLASLQSAGGGNIASTSSSGANVGLNSGGLIVNVASGLVAGNATRLVSTATGQYVTIEGNP